MIIQITKTAQSAIKNIITIEQKKLSTSLLNSKNTSSSPNELKKTSFNSSLNSKNISSIKNLGLEIIIKTGGCSGLQYDFQVANSSNFSTEETFFIETIYLFISKKSQPYLKNTTLNYHIELGQEYFEILLPKGKTKCGCGKSFGI